MCYDFVNLQPVNIVREVERVVFGLFRMRTVVFWIAILEVLKL